MKTMLKTAAVSFAMLCKGYAEKEVLLPDLRLPDGRVIRNVKLWKENEAVANYSYDEKVREGFGLINMVDLPLVAQVALGYSPEKEIAEKQQQADARKAFADAATLQSLSLRARTGSASRQEFKTWDTSWGSYEKTVDQNRALVLELRNKEEAGGAAYIEVLWLHNGADGKGKVAGVFSIQRSKLMLNAKQTIGGNVTSSFGREDNNYKALGIRNVSGQGFAGWIVRAVDPESGKVLAVQAMRTPLVEWSDKTPVGKKDQF
jgi:hypothetical protein